MYLAFGYQNTLKTLKVSVNKKKKGVNEKGISLFLNGTLFEKIRWVFSIQYFLSGYFCFIECHAKTSQISKR